MIVHFKTLVILVITHEAGKNVACEIVEITKLGHALTATL